MSAAIHKGIIREQLAQDELNASIEPVWNATRALCASDEECRARVLLALLPMARAAVERRLEARPPTIERDVAEALLDGYATDIAQAHADLAAAGNVITAQRVNLGFTTPRWGEW